MPTYQAECLVCGLEFDYHSSIADCLIVPTCVCSSREVKKVIRTAPLGFVHGKFEPFKSMIDGSTITTNRELKEHNARNGVMNLNEVYTEQEILEGKMHQRKVESQAEDIVKDIQESIHDVQSGYKPVIGTDDEL